MIERSVVVEKGARWKVASCAILLVVGLLAMPAFAGEKAPEPAAPQRAESEAPGSQAQVQNDDGVTYPSAEVSEAAPAERHLADKLREQLEAQGWEARPADDGSVIYRRPVAETPSLAQRLAEQLRAQGWQADEQEDGSVFYRRPEVSAAAPQRRLADKLREQLEAQGWEAHPADDGGVIYRRPVAETPSLAQRLAEQLRAQGWQADEQEDGSVFYRRPDVPPTQPTERHLADQLREQLEAQGWEAHPADDGGVIYRRPNVAQATFAERLRAQLEPHGWEVESNEDGSLIIRRPEMKKPETKAPADGTQGGLLERRTRHGGVRLFADVFRSPKTRLAGLIRSG